MMTVNGVMPETLSIDFEYFSLGNIMHTLHKVLAHAPNIISDFNNRRGLEQLSEERLEASDKLIRRYRERLSRKFSFQENIKDVFTRVSCQSEPVLLKNRKTLANKNKWCIT